MSQILAVFGATGTQGGSVINFVLSDPELSKTYAIRAVTRDVKSTKALELSKQVDVVHGDVLDKASLLTALAGVHTVFAMTTPSFGPDAVAAESSAGRAIADAAVEQGARYIIFSTPPSPALGLGGRYTGITPFEAKADAEQHIHGLPIKSAFFAGGYFMENFQAQPFLAPRRAPDGSYVLARPVAGGTRSPYIDAAADVGSFVGAILADPEKYEGKTFCAAAGLYSFDEVAAILTKATGKAVVYQQIPPETFRSGLASMLPPPLVDIFVQGMAYQGKFGYFGKDEEALVAWAQENARGKLTTLEEYFVKHPLQLV